MTSRSHHTLGQGAFLRLEKGLNAVFGEALNPVYYLGACANFLLWVVLLSGLYLYAFFETSVVQAYASVQALSQVQPWAGGLLRSLHRYASDALVLVVLLHLLRHFVFDRHRGYRWFSWVSGVFILWLTYASGVNGYMLPWDRLAQFVVTTTTEWFDVLPVIGGSMARNFITNAAVSDRLFSLLSFLHIGLPLSVLAVLWVHTQRVPGAKTLPPRPLMWTLMVTLTLLSLLRPALSQAPADMASLVARMDFDWFYLGVYALVPAWGARPVWALVLGATAALVLLPWLPQRRHPQAVPTQVWHLALKPAQRIISVRAGETLLDAGLREGLALPFECRNGGCGQCQCSVLHGQVTLLPFQAHALSAQDQAQGKTLLCCAQPLSDVEIDYTPPPGAAVLAPRSYQARVHSLDLLAPDVMRVRLHLMEAATLNFFPGQYLNILLPDGARRSYSFATAPHASTDVELHVRRIPGGRFSDLVFERLTVGDSLRFEGPLGAFTLRADSHKPIIFVAGATGFAPVKSMLEHAFHVGLQRHMVLYWGVRKRPDLYLGELAQQWAHEHANFRFVPVLSDPGPEDDWHGRTGLVHKAILEDFPDLSTHQVYACGSVQMVQAAHPAFVRQGVASDDCFSDAFHLAPQRALQHQQADLIQLGGVRV